jgi:hypothetical protein
MDTNRNDIKKNARNEDQKKNLFSTWLPLGKDSVALLRDSALFVLVLLLLFFPNTFNTILSNAGFEEGSFVGFKWKPKLLDSDKALKETQGLIAELREQNDKLSKALGDAQSKLSDPALKEQYAKLEEANKQLNIASSQVEDSVASTIASNATLVEKVQSGVDTRTTWGVVFGADTTLDDAKHEVETVAPKLGLPNASIYFRRGLYRSVSVSGSRSDAEQALSRARQRPAGGELVDMTTWCPISNEKNGYRECVSR